MNSVPSRLSRQDEWLATLGTAMQTLAGAHGASRATPQSVTSLPLSPEQRRVAGSLMRVNHVGEVCAQALYSAQSLTTRNSDLKTSFAHAAREERDHLAWTQQRLTELDARPSLLNPFWYTGAFCIGWVAGHVSDRISLGFLAETERQVEQHLASHLERLPVEDLPSRAIVTQMKEDEARHGADARRAGAVDLPLPVKGLMRAAAKLMTIIAYRI